MEAPPIGTLPRTSLPARATAPADPASELAAERRPGPWTRSWIQRAWWKVLLIGFVLYLAQMKLLAASGNPNLVPTVIFLGAFLVPVTYVVFLYEHGAFRRVSPPVVALTFFFGGVLGTMTAQLLEQQLVHGLGLVAMLAVGFSEEVAKLVAIAWLMPKKEYRSTWHGIIFGAAAGMGFAAFESMGYGFTFLLESRGDLNVLGEVLLTRGLLSPLGHGTWAAIVAGVLWRERFRINGAVLRAFFGVIALHGLWDWTAGAIPIGIPLPGLMLELRFVDLMIPELWLPIPALVIGFTGLWIMARLLRQAERRPTMEARDGTPARVRGERPLDSGTDPPSRARRVAGQS
jgi:protease PrsW